MTDGFKKAMEIVAALPEAERTWLIRFLLSMNSEPRPAVTILSERDSVAIVDLMEREPTQASLTCASKHKAMAELGEKDAADLRIILDAVRKSWALDPDKVAEFNAAVRLREKLETFELSLDAVQTDD